MPFHSNTPYEFKKTYLNVKTICKELESKLSYYDECKKKYSEDINEGSDFWNYVKQLEDSYNDDEPDDYVSWFYEKYQSVPMWKVIYKNFKEV